MKEKYKNICGVILAGGKATRYKGQNKALLKIDQETFYNRTSTLLSTIFEDVIVITNKASDFPEDNFLKYADLIKEIGPLGGIHSALTNAPVCEAVFVVAVDMPFISEAIIREICDAYQNNKKDILIPIIKQDKEPLAAVYSKNILGKLNTYLKETSDYSIRSFLKIVNTEYYTLISNTVNIKSFSNINTENDYRNLLKNKL